MFMWLAILCFYGKAIWKPGIVDWYLQHPFEPTAVRVSVYKTQSFMKTEVRKSARIKPCVYINSSKDPFIFTFVFVLTKLPVGSEKYCSAISESFFVKCPKCWFFSIVLIYCCKKTFPRALCRKYLFFVLHENSKKWVFCSENSKIIDHVQCFTVTQYYWLDNK